jgi:hypothetical protein
MELLCYTAATAATRLLYKNERGCMHRECVLSTDTAANVTAAAAAAAAAVVVVGA